MIGDNESQVRDARSYGLVDKIGVGTTKLIGAKNEGILVARQQSPVLLAGLLTKY